jgi:hypothetical protein
MPRFDLRQDAEALKPLAPFQVLAVMCCPTDRIRREKMVGDIQVTSGIAVPRRRPFSSEEFRREVRLSALKAAVAGGLLLTRLQLHLNGYRFSLAKAMPLVRALLPDWEPRFGGTWPKDASTRQWPHSRRKMLAAYDEYRSVSHLWAAVIHGGQHNRADIWPGSVETIPILLSYAEAILEIASSLPNPHQEQRFALTRSEVWSFLMPPNLVVRRKLEALPLNEEQLRIFNEQERRNALN